MQTVNRSRPLVLGTGVLLTIGGLAGTALAQAVKEDWRAEIGAGQLVLDSEDSVVFQTSGPENDFYAAKVDAAGNIRWISSAGDDISNEHVAWTAVDSQDNVIMTGHKHGITGGVMTAKWDGDGTLLWWDVINAGINSDSEGYVVGTDADDNIYVAGKAFVNCGGIGCYNFHTVKYDPQGNILWEIEAQTGSGPSSIAVSPEGRVALTGGGASDIISVVYDTDGNEEWFDVHPASGGGQDVKMAPDGTVFVCGTAIGGKGTILRYAPDGTKEWVVAYDSGPHGPFSYFRRMALDTSGNVIAVGSGSGRLAYLDWAAAKYDPAGNLLWGRHYDNGFDSNDEFAWDVVAGPDDSVYVTGSAGPAQCGGLQQQEAVIVKYTPAGDTDWVFQPLCSSNPFSIVLDSFGELVIDGTGSPPIIRVVQEEWMTLGNGLAGVSGIPDLTVRGYVEVAAPLDLQLENARPSAMGIHAFGLSRWDFPFRGGIVVPNLDLLVSFTIDPLGMASYSTVIPPGLATSVELYVQSWIFDSAAVQGLSASDAVTKARH